MPENKIQNPQKWLIVFLVYADFTDPAKENKSSILIGTEYMFKDIISTPIDPTRCRLSVIMDSSSYKTTADGKYIRNSIDRYEICKSDTDNFNEIRNRTNLYDSIQELDQEAFSHRKYHRHHFQSANPLFRILDNIEIKDDEEVLFITWDHGSGFGIFRDKDRTAASDSLPNVEAQLDTHPFLRTFWDFPISSRIQADYLTIEERNEELNIPDILDNSELADALSSWLEKKKIGVLLMMNCWMMNLHTIYAVKDVVKCLVAPQAEIGNPGYNYQAIIRCINNPENIYITPNDVAISCVTSRYNDEFKQRIKELGLQEKEIIEDCAVFAIDLQATKQDSTDRIIDEHFDLLAKIIDQIHSDLTNKNAKDITGNSVANLIRYTRPFADDFSGELVHLVDLYSYFSVLNIASLSLLHPSEFAPLITLTQKFVNSVVDSSFRKGNSILQGREASKPFYIQATTPHIVCGISGYSLFFRKNNQLPPKLSYNIKVDKLLKAMYKWKEILEMLYGREVNPA